MNNVALKHVTQNYYIHLFIQINVPIPVGKKPKLILLGTVRLCSIRSVFFGAFKLSTNT